MPSFQISVIPSRRAAARFVAKVRRALQKALAEENAKSGISQSDIARTIGVHRSVISRELRGYNDLTLGRIAELAYALGRDPSFELLERTTQPGSNTIIAPHPTSRVSTSSYAVEASESHVSNKAA